MTSSENNLALCIIKEYFGETARAVASLLIVKKFYPLPLIAADLSLDKKRVTTPKNLSISILIFFLIWLF